VGYCIEKNKELPALSIEEFRKFSPGFGEDVYKYLTAEDSVNSRSSYGGTARKIVLKRIKEIEKQAKG
jgi:argininosuccinate lyase